MTLVNPGFLCQKNFLEYAKLVGLIRVWCSIIGSTCTNGRVCKGNAFLQEMTNEINVLIFFHIILGALVQ